MAFYSVWDWNRNAWRVYQTPRPVSVGDDPIAPRGRGSALGLDPDTDVKALPSGARFVGYSHLARGEVRRTSLGLGDAGDDAGAAGGTLARPWAMFGLGAAVATGFAWWIWRRRR